jgi:predicted HTH transcriptional regulator
MPKYMSVATKNSEKQRKELNTLKNSNIIRRIGADKDGLWEVFV